MLFEFLKLGFEPIASLWPVSGDLSKGQFRIGKCYTTCIDLVENVDRFTNAGLYRDRLLRKLPIPDPRDRNDILIQLAQLLHRETSSSFSELCLQLKGINSSFEYVRDVLP